MPSPLRRAAVLDTIRAWTDPGSHPDFHRAWQDRLRREWPTLGRALDNLASSQARAEDTVQVHIEPSPPAPRLIPVAVRCPRCGHRP